MIKNNRPPQTDSYPVVLPPNQAFEFPIPPEMTKGIVITRTPIGGDKPLPPPKPAAKPKPTKGLSKEEIFDRVVNYIDEKTAPYRKTTVRTRFPKTPKARAKQCGQLLAELPWNNQVKSKFAEIISMACGYSITIASNTNNDSELKAEDVEERSMAFKNSPRCAALVPLSNPNSHNYTIGQPCVVIATEGFEEVRCVKMNATAGNNLLTSKEYTRAATRAEIITWVTTVGVDRFQEIFNVIII